MSAARPSHPAWSPLVFAGLAVAVVLSFLEDGRGRRDLDRADAGARRARATLNADEALTVLPEGPVPEALRRRLVRESLGRDDQARWLLLRSVVQGAGGHCDRVTTASMEVAGDWRVACAPGRRYRVRFTPDGDLSEASPIP